VHPYRRDDLLRILRITAKQLTAWERAGVIHAADEYSFSDLAQIKKVRDLCAHRLRPAMIRQSLEAMQRRAAGMENPLLEASAQSSGSSVAFRHQGRLLEPVSGQFVMDFSGADRLVAGLPAPAARGEAPDTDITDLFAQGVALEEDPGRHLEAMAIYEYVLLQEPAHAAAHINLGTILYNRQDFAGAEQHYRQAIAADPRYALAYFDLGNVLDETGRVREAIEMYRNALRLAPTYADSSYNLALAYEKIGEPRKALKHWRAYVQLDATGPWSAHARSQIRKIIAADVLKLVYRRLR
jgi:tetratricopeptide (TPR) repeat protein